MMENISERTITSVYAGVQRGGGIRLDGETKFFHFYFGEEKVHFKKKKTLLCFNF